MTIKRIFVPLCPPQWSGPALNAGISIARNLNAHVEGAYIPESTTNSVEFADSQLDVRHYSEVVTQVQNQIHREAEVARAEFEGLVSSQNLSLSDNSVPPNTATASWLQWTSDPVEMVTTHGGASDLIVVNLPTLGPTATPAPIRDAALSNTACPVFLVGKNQNTTRGKSVMIAWNRSLQSRRAVTAALPFLKRADSVSIVNVSTRAKEGPEPEQIAKTLSLAWH